jgi:TonB family protein
VANCSSGVNIFQTLENSGREDRRRWLSFGAGLGAHGLGLALVLALGILFPAEIELWVSKAPIYVDLEIQPIPVGEGRPQPKPNVRLEAPQLPPKQIQMPLIAEKQPMPDPEPPKVALQVPPLAEPAPALEPARLAPQLPPVRMGAFEGSPAVATRKLPAREVQTGGFGSPEGFTGQALGGSRGNVARLGSFDLPTGPGYGNGLGGTHGARGTVASAGFGSGIATANAGSGGRGGVGRGTVQSGGFDLKPVAQTPGARRPEPPSSLERPVEIISKPNPAFTEEARRLGIQGEVVLSVIFTAVGKLRVLNVIQGLGHGLDESAWRAAEQIQFKPAQRDGQPVDFPATLRVVFQLSG